ncbi:DUF1559 domain-containing protein [Rosistilla oblonga]|uniref:DUF1559 domain-containing protein n=1 Tax=Rosistilla oblonga TaxID=2527990 RepID=A0A518IW28_9BACT|nr:DUF1559 domain-containing protein [Rosistilla oblonga]QDV57290.1 hypothetical protein Mal33_32940 [Rosistilla oblonga]
MKTRTICLLLLIWTPCLAFAQAVTAVPLTPTTTEAPASPAATAQPAQPAAEKEAAAPESYDSLAQRKSQLIGEYRDAEQQQQSELAIEKLAELFAVEVKLLEMAEEQLGADNVDLANAYRATPQGDGSLLAFSLYELGDYKRSAEFYSQTLNIARRRTDLKLEVYNDLVWLNRRAQRLAEATPEEIERYNAALKTSKEVEALMGAKQYDRVVASGPEALATRREIAGITPRLASEYGSLAAALVKTGKNEEAEEAYDTTLEMYEQTLGKETVRYATILYNKAIFYRDLDRLADAEAALLETRRIENRLGVDVESQMMTLNEIAGLYRKTQEAEKFDGIVGEYRRLERNSHLGLVALQRHIPLDAYLVGSFDPAALVEDESLKFLPHELLASLSSGAFGVDPAAIQSAVGFLSVAPIEQALCWGVLLKPLVGEQLALKLPVETAGASLGDFNYQKTVSESGGVACHGTLADGTLFVGTEAALKQVLAMQRAKPEVAESSKLSRRLREMHGSGKALVAFDMSKVQLFAQAVFAEMPPVPPQLANLKSLPDHLDSASLVVSFKESPYVSLQMLPRADSSVDNLGAIAQQALEFGANQLLQTVTDGVQAAGSPIAQPVQAYLERVIRAKYQELTPRAEAGQLVIQMDNILDVEAALHVGLLIPAVQGAQMSAQGMSGMNNLKQIALAMHNYHDTYATLPGRRVRPDGKPTGLSWRVHVLPFLEQTELYEQFRLDEPWDSDHNKALIEKMPAVFASPGIELPAGKTIYLTLDGSGTLMQNDSATRFRDITDGLSNTIMAVEANPDQAVVWTKPDDLAYDPQQPLVGLGQSRPEGFYIMLADGAVRLQSADVDPKTVAAMASIAGGEVIELE